MDASDFRHVLTVGVMVGGGELERESVQEIDKVLTISTHYSSY